jgi:hypothetical protein
MEGEAFRSGVHETRRRQGPFRVTRVAWMETISIRTLYPPPTYGTCSHAAEVGVWFLLAIMYFGGVVVRGRQIMRVGGEL